MLSWLVCVDDSQFLSLFLFANLLAPDMMVCHLMEGRYWDYLDCWLVVSFVEMESGRECGLVLVYVVLLSWWLWFVC